jgi:hypothetical protein
MFNFAQRHTDHLTTMITKSEKVPMAMWHARAWLSSIYKHNCPSTLSFQPFLISPSALMLMIINIPRNKNTCIKEVVIVNSCQINFFIGGVGALYNFLTDRILKSTEKKNSLSN